MKDWSLAVTLSVALAGSLSAAQTRSDPPAGAERPAANATETQLPATTIRVRGTIATYDGKGSILALSTQNGVVRFPVADETRIRRAGKTVDRQELKSLTGYRAAVRYSEAGGHTTVESVNVFEKGERNPR